VQHAGLLTWEGGGGKGEAAGVVGSFEKGSPEAGVSPANRISFVDSRYRVIFI
jgi:hypothetical protein